MPRKRNRIWLTCTDAKNLFGIHPDSLKSRAVPPRSDLLDENTQYDAYDIVRLCGDLIGKKFKAASPGADQSNHKDRLARIRADSAEIDLASKVGALIPAKEVSKAFDERLKRIRDPILSIPSTIKKRVPDISPAALQIIGEIISHSLNQAAENNDHSNADS